MRYFLTTNSAPGMDLRFDEEKILASWNYINKIWNISRYINMNIDETISYDEYISYLDLELPESAKWILAKLDKTIKEADEAYDKFDFGIAAKTIYSFVWDDFASWFVELSKVDLANNQYKKQVQATLLYVLTNVLKLLHPFMPFVTEEIYQLIPHNSESICIASWPTLFNKYTEVKNIDLTIEIITAIRNMRHNANKGMSIALNIDILGPASLENSRPYFNKFVNPNNLTIKDTAPSYEACTQVLADATIYIPMNELINIEEEISKLEASLKKLENELTRSKNMLSNPNFVNKAPEAKINQEKEKLQSYEKQYQNVLEELNKLKK